MEEKGLKARIRRKWKSGKYIKHHTYENVLNREFKTDIPNEKYVSDVTQLKMLNGKKYYLYPIMDLYNNEIKADTIHSNNDNFLVESSLDKIDLSDVKIMDSDQGAQFTSQMYREELGKYENIEISMSHVGECYDNPQTEQELYENMNEYITYYNEERIQLKFKMSPIHYRTQNT